MLCTPKVIHHYKISKMKRILILLILSLSLGIAATAQTETKVKKTSTVGQKIHNTFSKHKHHKGYKIKRKKANGHKTKKTVNYEEGKTTIKRD